MDKVREYNLQEAIADIALNAGYYIATDKIKEESINDLRNLISDIITWAKEFEASYNPDTDEDYLSAIDRFSEVKLLGRNGGD